jgi:hypothetical protein
MIRRFFDWASRQTPAYKSLARSHSRYSEITGIYARSLREIVSSVDNVGAPNGTTRKLGRIANEAFIAAAEV